jgi:ABC-type Fe3+-hydroxamate transport system substrate-binding protein
MEFIDQMNRTIKLERTPKRLISLVPSQTEFLYDLGLAEEVLGITKFCCHPKHWLKEKVIVGGTKKLNLRKIRDLNPDLIIGNKEENTKEDIEQLEKEFPVWMSDIYTFQDSLNMMKGIGEVTNRFNEAQELVLKLRDVFDSIPKIKKPLKYAYVIWHNPTMFAGKETYIDAFLSQLGFENACKSVRYPIHSTADVSDVQLVLLSSEPFPFKSGHLKMYEELFPNAKVMLADGEVFSWYGTRLLHTTDYLKNFIEGLKNG